MKYQSTKTYGHDRGFSCAFRQWRADSHCSFIHGYSLGFKFVFEADDLDAKNWVVDFGGLKSLKERLEYWFDHTTVIAKDDPCLPMFEDLHQAQAIQLRVIDAVGCEKFAEFVFKMADAWLEANKYKPRVRLVSVEVSEHGSNSAIVTGV